MASDRFYADLPALERFIDLANPDHYVEAPADWYVLLTDVVDSTRAIAQGQYKEVNVLGASSIMAVINAVGPLEIPFTFGGDGAVLLVPPSVLFAAREALLGLRAIARRTFDLDLRVGVVPIAAIQPEKPVKVAKFQMTPSFGQGSFMGGGISYAETLVKTDPAYRLEINGSPAVTDLTGLECRWQAIPSPHGHTLSLIVVTLPSEDSGGRYIYREVIEAIHQIYGDRYHPVTLANLKLSLNPLNLMAEAKAKGQGMHRWRWVATGYLQTLMGMSFMGLGLRLGEVDWGDYRRAVWAASDYQKIDDLLRMVIAGSPRQTQQLTDYLDARSRQGHLAYGLHVSDRALMTCLVPNRGGYHFHLIDGADGGYTLAARNLKRQLHQQPER